MSAIGMRNEAITGSSHFSIARCEKDQTGPCHCFYVVVCRMVETEDCVGPGIVTLCGPGHHRMDFCSQAGTQEPTHLDFLCENGSLLIKDEIQIQKEVCHVSAC